MTKLLTVFISIAVMILISHFILDLVIPSLGSRNISLAIVIGAVAGFYIYTLIDNKYLD
ncbi:hypothetical protein [Phocicoccus pinnipedialis]|uniref:Uncharacterized protein n=1 Tax=Phocicoccus pinnipedialis TaxID=110845 RepID=A0A6V7RA41_9BACL|nr:hypothetical protein [Jeotgalicoccus pinnipedialis]MBP1940172.1 uncharacterized membrane protein (DUF441 family) [Jeotgalicoccus pinnipedialis]CAD2073844.1 hypothetical protein JEOPIN946_00752 [Jeotgalicoccus pinnipedialis]